MLNLEIVIGLISTFTFLIMLFVGLYAESFPTFLRAILIAFGTVQFFVAMIFALKIETEAGYYECPHCGERYVPDFWKVTMAMHLGRTRKLKCPHCGKRGWHKKMLTKEK